MSYLSDGTVLVQSHGLNSALSLVVYGDIALSIKKINTQIAFVTQVTGCFIPSIAIVTQVPGFFYPLYSHSYPSA